MHNWTSYAYCARCDRPLRENEYRIRRSEGTTFCFCRLCNSRARKPYSLIQAIGQVTLELIVLGVPCIYWLKSTGIEPAKIRTVVFLITLYLMLAHFVQGWWQKSKCKPIYDRWVMQHGTYPDNWPNHCSGEFEAYSETPDGKISAKLGAILEKTPDGEILAKLGAILETALIFLLLAFLGGSLVGWPGVSCAAAITIFNFRAQHLSKKAARTTAESLGRSLGRSLGWLLFGHPIVFWGLLIGALVAFIYWWSVGAFE